MKKNIILLIFSFFLISLIMNNDIKADALNFSVNPILSKNMEKFGYYRVEVKKGQIVNVKLKINNFSSKKIVVKNLVNDAHNGNGSISYNLKANDAYRRSNPTFESMVLGKKNRKISLKPNQSKILNIKLKIPKKGINGQVLGGIHSSKKNQTDIFNFSNAILLESNRKDAKLKDVFVKNIIPITNKADFDLINNQPYLISKYKVNFKLYNKDKKKINKNEYDYSMVPNSKSKVSFSFDDLNPGSYYLKIGISDQKGNVKYFDKHFTIKSDKENIPEGKISLMVLLIAGGLAALYFLVIKTIFKIKQKKGD